MVNLLKKTVLILFPAVLAVMLHVSCTRDPPMVSILYEPAAGDPYTIQFSTLDEHVDSYSWDFGDGQSSSEAAPVHTYSLSGNYTVHLEVEGRGGTASANVEIDISPSLEELLSGGPDAIAGKTWVVSGLATPGLDGAGQVTPDFPTDIIPARDSLLALLGLGEEYDNEYTFFHDGSYQVDTRNGAILAGTLYTQAVLSDAMILTFTQFGFLQVAYDNVYHATWTLTENTDLTVDAVKEDGTGGVTEETVTFTGADVIGFGSGAFIGLLDFTPEAIIREISADRMVLTVFLHRVEGYPLKPSNLLTISFDAKKN
jgi:PKD repeat protein